MKKILFALVALAFAGFSFAGVFDDESNLPLISFVEQIPEEVGGPVNLVTGQKPKDDDSYEEYKTGSTLDLFLAILKKDKDGIPELCTEECNGVWVTLHHRTSPGIELVPEEPDFGDVQFRDGFATIKVRSTKEYRWNADPSLNNPGTLAVMIRDDRITVNDDILAIYNPLFFSEDGIEGIKKAPAARNLGARNFEVMDLQGRVVRQGFTTEAEPVVQNVAPGSYIVKVGNTVHRVNIR